MYGMLWRPLPFAAQLQSQTQSKLHLCSFEKPTNRSSFGRTKCYGLCVLFSWNSTRRLFHSFIMQQDTKVVQSPIVLITHCALLSARCGQRTPSLSTHACKVFTGSARWGQVTKRNKSENEDLEIKLGEAFQTAGGYKETVIQFELETLISVLW